MKITRKRIEAAMDKIAYYMVEHDRPQFAPIYERLERELEALDKQDATVARARQRLQLT
jgi:hypothetical protein